MKITDKKFNFASGNMILSSSYYLSKLDSIGRYNFQNISEVPSIRQIKIRLTSQDLINSSTSTNLKENLETMLFRAHLLLYLLTDVKPKVRVIKQKTNKGSISEDDISTNYLFEVVLTNKNQIYPFLELISSETMLFVNNFTIEESYQLIKQKGHFYTKINLSEVFEMNELARLNYTDLNLEKLSMNVTFLYSTFPSFIKEDICDIMDMEKIENDDVSVSILD